MLVMSKSVPDKGAEDKQSSPIALVSWLMKVFFI